MFASFANVDVFGTKPRSVATTLFADEPLGPFGPGQILVTSIDVIETLVKFNFGVGKILCDDKIGHGGLLFCS
jgi:hypothetical protein